MRDDPSVARSGDRTERSGSTVRRPLEADEMRDPDREPDDVGSPGSRAKPLRLCIISRDRLLTGEFLKTLETLDPDDELEIIPDRRRANPSVEAKPGTAEQPSVDRRRHLDVDNRLKVDGFAIVRAIRSTAHKPPRRGSGSSPSPHSTWLSLAALPNGSRGAYKHPRRQANEDSPTFELTQPAPEDLVHVVTSLPLICVLQFDDLRP
jgi:hypothetical protein